MSSPTPIRREVGGIALLLTGLGSIIGSGWLFGAWRVAGLAGSSAVWAWVLGGVIMTTIALTYAELGALFPESGGTVRYGHYSHGSLVGFIAAWANWISSVSVIPVEAEASVQYMAGWDYQWAKDLYMHAPGGKGELTPPGIAIAAVLCFILCMNAFATPLLLGGPHFQMMAPLLFWAFSSDNNWPFAAAIAFILMATTLLLTAAANRLIPRRYRV